jgi:isoleucyl-tRNA synthetase
MDVCKDTLYCDGKEDTTRRGAQTAMAYILRSLLTLVAPILTYTADEVVEFMPEFLKEGKTTVFEFERFELPDTQSDFDAAKFMEVRNGFFEVVDELKKEGNLKSTLELTLATDSGLFDSVSKKEMEDLFLVSDVVGGGEALREFEAAGMKFTVSKSLKHKCPRCWRHVSNAESEPCERCAKVVS